MLSPSESPAALDVCRNVSLITPVDTDERTLLVDRIARMLTKLARFRRTIE